MNCKLWLFSFITFSFIACHNSGSQQEPQKKRHHPNLTYSFPDVIPLDSANKMLSSYLSSINYQSNDTDIQSWIFDAKLLRKYLDSLPGSGDISFVKIGVAHKLSYINSGHANQRAGYKSAALTVLVSGYTSNGDYIFYPENLVIDNAMACPTNCPPGAAAAPLFPATISKR